MKETCEIFCVFSRIISEPEEVGKMFQEHLRNKKDKVNVK